jgi:hypothetical protein
MAAYYYGNGQQMPLCESSTQIAIRRDTLPPIQDWDIFLAQITEIDHNVELTLFTWSITCSTGGPAPVCGS